MARIWTSGFETNYFDVNENSEWHPSETNGTIVAIQSSIVRSGSYALRIHPSGNTGYVYRLVAGQNLLVNRYFRAYIYVVSLPSSDIFTLAVDDAAGGDKCGFVLTTAGNFQFWDLQNNVQIGSNSGVISLNRWYKLEMRLDTTVLASSVIEGYLDNLSFGSSTVNLTNGQKLLVLYAYPKSGATVTTDIYYDDIAVNDNTGSYQNAYPGEGHVIHLMPDSAGDNTQWSRGGTDSGANWSQVNDQSPNFDTNYIKSQTLDQIDDYNIASSNSIAASDIINVLHVTGFFTDETITGTNPQFRFRLKDSSGGTVTESATQIMGLGGNPTIHANWFFITADGENFFLTSYTRPSLTTLWKKSDLDTAQIGIHMMNNPTGNLFVTNLYLIVDYAPDKVNVAGRHMYRGRKNIVSVY